MLELEEKSLAHYAIQRRLARGGMSQVYLASDKRTQQLVAIKVVNRSEDDFFVRFQREIKTLSALSHKHILPIIEFGEHGSWHYPFALSFSTYKNDAPMALGANVQFAKQVEMLHQLPDLPKSGNPVTHPTPSPTAKSSGQNNANSDNSHRGHQRNGNGHGHKRGRGHGN